MLMKSRSCPTCPRPGAFPHCREEGETSPADEAQTMSAGTSSPGVIAETASIQFQAPEAVENMEAGQQVFVRYLYDTLWQRLTNPRTKRNLHSKASPGRSSVNSGHPPWCRTAGAGRRGKACAWGVWVLQFKLHQGRTQHNGLRDGFGAFSASDGNY